MEDEKRVTVRISGPLYQVIVRQAEQAGVKLSEQLRRMVMAAQPHLAVLEDVWNILAAGNAAIERGEPYLPYLRNCEKRLELGLQELKAFDKLATAWRQEAEAELTACLTRVRQQAQQHQWTGELIRFFEKTSPAQGGQDERNV
jgi:hypothetical protein